MIVVDSIGLLTAIAVANLQQAIAEVRQKACALHRRNIDATKLRWSVEHQSPLTATPTDYDLSGQAAYIE